jgi:MSHA biogenesis protein MshJ
MQYWQLVSSKFEARNNRERLIICCALLVMVYGIIDVVLLKPVLTRQKLLTSESEADQSQIQNLTLKLNELSHMSIVDPDTQNNERIAALQSNLIQLESQLSGLQTTLIPPDKMPELLRSLLKKNSKLKLIELKTLTTRGLLESSPDETSKAKSTSVLPEQNSSEKQTVKTSLPEDAPVFKHGVEITVEGHYLDLLEYVSELEKMPWHILWSKADLNAKNYPANQLKLTVYTLSLDKTWLSI